jgi:alpha-tubulin suppressor-like RCC1 family protein
MKRKLAVALHALLWLSACSKHTVQKPEKPTPVRGPQGNAVKPPDASPSVLPDARREAGMAARAAAVVRENRVSFSAVHVAVGGHHSMIVDKDRTLWTSGSNEFGQLGINDKVSLKDGFQKVMEDVCDVAAGSIHSLVLACDGSVWAAGSNSSGQFGVTAPYRNYGFQKIASDAAAIAARGYVSMVIKRDQTLWVTGDHASFYFGVGKPGNLKAFTKIMDGVQAVSIGDNHVLILKTDGTVWGSGDNRYDQLGIETIDDKGRRKFPNGVSVPVEVMSEAIAVAAGGYHSLVLKKDNTLWGTGWNEYGQLGSGDNEDRHGFEKILSKVVAVAGGNRLTMALRTDGILWAVGGTGFGENQKVDQYDNKKRVLFGRNLGEVNVFATSWDSSGTFEGHSLAIKKDGTVWGYGGDGWGVFGRGYSDADEWKELFRN